MSSSNPYTPPPTPYFTNLGFGYSIAIALGFLFLLSTLILSSYLCCRTLRNRNNRHNRPQNNPNDPDGIVLPRVIFVAEDDDDERHRSDVVSGLDLNVINSYPKFPYSKDGGYDGTCSICLCEYKDSEMLRMMPECRHHFHLCCLDSWLKLNGSCPVCRNSPMPTPLSTPLQEVVPLAQYAADRSGRSHGPIQLSSLVDSLHLVLIHSRDKLVTEAVAFISACAFYSCISWFIAIECASLMPNSIYLDVESNLFQYLLFPVVHSGLPL
ncbi:hypothetical protein RJT34_15589 [Clitoria ternatea]|uniref:RING-type domain-containing protein n=1 Tax=Clitoria ternatea TaxID=43366 RepID=A0AAN9J5Q2_CLITE